MNTCAQHPEATVLERTFRGRGGCPGCLADPHNLDGCDPEPLGQPVVEVDYLRGVCFCDGCGAVIRVQPRVQQEPRVLDADGRGHRCERYIAGALDRGGAPGLAPVLRAHAGRPVVGPPLRAARPAPAPRPARGALDF